MSFFSKPFCLCILLTIFTVSIVTGCNTIEGAGEDLQEAGGHIESTAEDAAD